MPDLDVQIRAYLDATSEPLTVDDVLYVPVGDTPVRPITHRTTRRRLWRGWLVAGAAAAVLLVVFGLLPFLLRGGSIEPAGTTVPTPTTVPVTTSTVTTVEAAPVLGPEIHPFVVDGAIDVEWVEPTGEAPYGIDSYDLGVYATAGDGGRYTADELVSWVFEAVVEGALVPDDVSEDGQWGMAKGFIAGTLLRNVDGEWQVAPRPPQAQQSGEWGWMRHLESSGDVLIVLGGPAEPGSDGYPAEETAAYWRIEGSGEWQKINLDGDSSNGGISSVPAGGFAYYNETDRTIHTSVDGVRWAEGVSTDHPYWESGDEVFPGLVYAETAGQFWTSADSTTWTYAFTGPPGGDYGLHLSRTNLGIVATRVTQIPGDGSNSDTSIDAWLLAEDRRSWSALTSFSIGTLSYGAVDHGAAGDLVWLGVTGGEEPTLTPQNRLWTAQLSNE